MFLSHAFGIAVPECSQANNIANALFVCIRKTLLWKYNIILEQSLKDRVTSHLTRLNDISFLIGLIEKEHTEPFFIRIGKYLAPMQELERYTEVRLQVSYRKVQSFDRLHITTREKTPCIVMTADHQAMALCEQQWWQPSANAMKYVVARCSDGQIEMGQCPVYDIRKYQAVVDADTQKAYLYHYELSIELVESRHVFENLPGQITRAWTCNPTPTRAYLQFLETLLQTSVHIPPASASQAGMLDDTHP
jgi:hypothetical protein